MTALSNQPDPRRRPSPLDQQGTYQMITQRAPAHQLPQTPPQRPTKQYPQPTARRGQWQRPDDEDDETEEDEALDDMDDDDDAMYPPARTPRSALPYRPTHTQPYAPAPGVPSRASHPNRGLIRQPVPEPEPRAPRRRRRRMHWLFYVGLGFFVMVVGWILLGALSSWWQTTWDDWHYGYPRTYQTDAVVGHNDSATNPSHFIAINLHSHIEVIEFPGGDVTKARVYIGPTLIGAGQDVAPVTLTFKDVNGDGKPDMIVTVGENTFVFINDAGQFRPARPGEQLTL